MSTLAVSSSSLPENRVAEKQNHRTGWQLTRRGRFVFRGLPLLTLLALLLLGAVSYLLPQSAQAGDQEGQKATEIVQVKSGQSLWDIASEVASEQDVRDVVNEIMDLNDLASAKIQAGERLEVPVYSAQ